MYKEAEFQVSEVYLVSFLSYEFFHTPVSFRFIHWTHAECGRRHITLLVRQLAAIAQHKVGREFKKAYWHVLRTFESTGNAQNGMKSYYAHHVPQIHYV